MGASLRTDWMIEPLPEYETPPVVETALAVEFAQLKGWNVVHYGVLWERFKAKYPNCEVQPLLFAPTPAEFSFQDPPLRCFFFRQGKNPTGSDTVGWFCPKLESTAAKPQLSTLRNDPAFFRAGF